MFTCLANMLYKIFCSQNFRDMYCYDIHKGHSFHLPSLRFLPKYSKTKSVFAACPSKVLIKALKKGVTVITDYKTE